MKKLLFATAVIALLISCSKNEKKENDEKENHCPAVTASAVPQ